MTLVELLIATALMGLLAGALSVVVTTVIKLSPAAEDRNDDANALLSLTAYMPEDVNSTPAGGFEFDKNLDSGCSTTSTDPGVNLVRMTWTEVTTTTTTHVASYRYENNGGGFKIIRYACLAGGPPSTFAMSESLPSIDPATWTAGDAPVSVLPHEEDFVFNGLTFTIDTEAGDVFSFEMRTNDLAETLPPVAPINQALIPSNNQPPVAGDVTTTTTYVTPVQIGLPASDPDGDGLTVTLTNVPTNWTTSISGLTVTISPHNTWNPGDAKKDIGYTVSDPWGETASGNIEISIVLAPTANTAPTAADVNDNVVVGTSLVVNLPVSDADNDPLAVTTSTPDPSLIVDISETTLTITSDGTNLSPPPFTYTVSDGVSTATANITLSVTQIPCNVTSLTPLNRSVELKNNGYLKQTVTYTVAYTGECSDLVLAYDNNLADGYQAVFLAFGSGTTVTHQGNNGGLKWTPGIHTMTLQRGEGGAAILTADLDVD